MILKRMADAIRELNWFTVIIEFFIVVVGIFVGLQVDDWNQSRKAESARQLFLVQLDEDIVGVLSNVDYAVAEHQGFIDTGKLALRYLQGEDILSEHQSEIESALELMHQLPSPRLLNGHLNGLLSGATGRILVNQPEQRDLVALASKLGNAISIYRHIEREIVVATSLNKKMVGFSSPNDDELKIVYDSETLRDSAQFKISMQNAIVFHAYSIRTLEIVAKELRLYQDSRSDKEQEK